MAHKTEDQKRQYRAVADSAPIASLSYTISDDKGGAILEVAESNDEGDSSRRNEKAPVVKATMVTSAPALAVAKNVSSAE